MRTSDAQPIGDRAHRPSPGNEIERNNSLWDGLPLIIWRNLALD